MKIINEQLLDETQAKALQSPRLRMNYNFHERLDDPINRLLNAMEPGTYLRPHRHLNPAKDEIFLLLRGKVAVFLFDEEGNITEKTILNPKEGAYVAEIVRGGIMSVDAGQMEAGRSLGMNYTQTMRHIIIPQAIKNILPALGNEMITLLKDTSLMTVIGAKDLTKAAQTVQAVTYQAFMPYISIAVVYLVCVIALSKLLALIERRMRNSDRR